MTHLLDGLPDLRNPPDAQDHTKMDRRLACQLRIYSIKDTHAKLYKVVILGTIYYVVSAATTVTNPKPHHVSDLIQLGFYFCLRY